MLPKDSLSISIKPMLNWIWNVQFYMKNRMLFNSVPPQKELFIFNVVKVSGWVTSVGHSARDFLVHNF